MYQESSTVYNRQSMYASLSAAYRNHAQTENGATGSYVYLKNMFCVLAILTLTKATKKMTENITRPVLVCVLEVKVNQNSTLQRKRVLVRPAKTTGCKMIKTKTCMYSSVSGYTCIRFPNDPTSSVYIEKPSLTKTTSQNRVEQHSTRQEHLPKQPTKHAKFRCLVTHVPSPPPPPAACD